MMMRLSKSNVANRWSTLCYCDAIFREKTTNYLNKKCAIQIGNQAAMPQGPAIELSNKNTSGFQRLTIYMHWAVI